MASTTTSSTWDKSKPYFPVAGLANDGWSTDDEATASCFCGAVQLSFVSFRTEFVAAFLPSNIPLANSWPWFRRLIYLQLFRLSQTHCINPRKQLYDPRHALEALTRPGKPEDVCSIEDSFRQRTWKREHHDQLLLFNLRFAHVSCRCGFPGNEYLAPRQCG
jgi:hypothetical protein